MRVACKTELAPAKLSPQEQSGDQSHNRQRNGLLPIHAGNITAKSVRATDFDVELSARLLTLVRP
jgi:hypothetical protein